MKKTKEIEKYLNWERKVKIVLAAEKLGRRSVINDQIARVAAENPGSGCVEQDKN